MKVMVLVVMAFSCLAAQAQDWEFSAAASGYIVPNGTNYVWSVIAADRRRLHLEGHYNYEDLRTGSAWIGYNFSAVGNVSLKYTPMVGVASITKVLGSPATSLIRTSTSPCTSSQ